jgi:hypothetical protein
VTTRRAVPEGIAYGENAKITRRVMNALDGASTFPP